MWAVAACAGCAATAAAGGSGVGWPSCVVTGCGLLLCLLDRGWHILGVCQHVFEPEVEVGPRAVPAEEGIRRGVGGTQSGVWVCEGTHCG